MDMRARKRKTSDIDHEDVSHKSRQIDERDQLSNDSALDELADLKEKLEIAGTKGPSSRSSWCIYKVPPKLRKVNEEAYTPSLVSIGPYHFGNYRLKGMQELKVWYLDRFLKRTPEKTLEDYFKALKDREDEIRNCYFEIKYMESDKFVSMVLTDACFIIEFFLEGVNKAEHLVPKLWATSYTLCDLILLENQLPFFVLTLLFYKAFPDGFIFDGQYSSFDEITFHFFHHFLDRIYPNKKTHKLFDQRNLIQGKHLCDVLRNCFFPHIASQRLEAGMEFQAEEESSLTKLRTCFLPRDSPPRQTPTMMHCLHSVSQLHEVGMEFHADKENFLPVLRYSKEVLTIPGIVVNDSTETMLRNVIAFEQCHYHLSSNYVTDYVTLLDSLINNGKDVEILVEKKIMVNLLGDNYKVASMVNRLCKNVPLTNTEGYSPLCREMDKFCESRYHKYKAIFVREYWSTPWKKASSIAAVLLLSFTLIQTICSIISLFKN